MMNTHFLLHPSPQVPLLSVGGAAVVLPSGRRAQPTIRRRRLVTFANLSREPKEANVTEDGDPIRFGLIGCGEIARKVSRAITLAPNSTLHAVGSRSIDKAKQFADKIGLSDSVKAYGSYDEVLDDPSVDVVYMPLPTSLHLEWAVSAAQKKKHVLVEKPAALNVKQLDQILEACQSNGVQFMDGSMWCHHPRTAKLKEFLSDQQRLGPIRAIHSTATFLGGEDFLKNNIRVKSNLDALGVLGDMGWYSIGTILLAMNNQLPTTVTTLPPAIQNEAGVILSCDVSMYWKEQETCATFHTSFLELRSTTLDILAPNGLIRLEDFVNPFEEASASFKFTSGVELFDLHVGWKVESEEVVVPSELPQDALLIQEFARLVKGIKHHGCKPDSKWPDFIRRNQLVADAVVKSIELGYQPVYL